MAVADIAVGAVGLRFEQAVDEDRQPAVAQAARHGDVVPPTVVEPGGATERKPSVPLSTPKAMTPPARETP